MKASKVLYAEISSVLAKSSFANTILYPYNPKLSKFLWLPHYVYTKFCLSQISNQFPDFKASEFSDVSIRIYHEIYQAVHKSNRGDLLKLLTPPKAEMIRLAQKSNKKLPFELYEKILRSKLVYVRVSSNSNENSAIVNFAHITMKMDFLTEAGEEKTQFNVFERRFDNKLKEAWRVGFIDDS